MVASIEPVVSGFCLVDPNDPRYLYIAGLRRRFGEFLHTASVSLQQRKEAENAVDAIHLLVSVLS
jgi:proteasome activator subunit 4